METHVRKRQKPASHTSPKQQRAPRATKRSSYNALKLLQENPVILILVLMVLGGFVLKYFEDEHHFKESFTEFGDNAYEVLGVSRSASEQDIKANYRQLNHKWHPDKNPNCEECKEKFMKIKAAYKILGNPELKALYDRTNGRTVDVISSATTELTLQNFDELVTRSGDVWVVQVYSDDSPECHRFSTRWEDAATRLGEFARFGRINKLMHPHMMKKLPIKAQLLPAVIMLMPDGGYDLFPQEVLNSYDVLKKHFMTSYPNVTRTCKDYGDFKKQAGDRPAMLFRHTGSKQSMPLPLMYVSLRYKWAFDIFWISTDTPLHSEEQFMSDLMASSEDGSTLAVNTAFFQLLPNVDAMALFYSPGASQLLATAPYSRGSVAQLMGHINSMVTLSYPPLELSRDTFDHLCVNSGDARNRFCLVIAGNSEAMIPQKKVLQKLGEYEHFSAIGNIFSKKLDESDSGKTPVASADLQLVSLPENLSTDKLKAIVGTGVVLVDAKREKFCVVAGGTGRYACEFEEDEELEWVGNLTEGAFDTIMWYDVLPVFGGKFKEMALLSTKSWYKFFLTHVRRHIGKLV